MKSEHDFPTQLIAPYAKGELSPEETDFVEGHLAACEECQAELRGYRALGGAMFVAPLDDLERSRLHRGVLTATIGEPELPARRSIAARIAPALGAAAMVALLLFGGVQLFSGGMGGEDSESAGDAGVGAALEADGDDQALRADAGGPLGLPPASARVADGTGETTESAPFGDEGSAGSDDAATTESSEEIPAAEPGSTFSGQASSAPEPYFEPGQRLLTERSLRNLGRTRDPFDSYALRFTTADATAANRNSRTRSLAMASFEPGLLRRCAGTVLDRDPTALPAYGALGTFESRDVLVLGFAVNTARGGRLDRYDIWVWPLGECSAPVARFRGRI